MALKTKLRNRKLINIQITQTSYPLTKLLNIHVVKNKLLNNKVTHQPNYSSTKLLIYRDTHQPSYSTTKLHNSHVSKQ